MIYQFIIDIDILDMFVLFEYMNKITFEDDLPLLSDKPAVALAKIQKKM